MTLRDVLAVAADEAGIAAAPSGEPDSGTIWAAALWDLRTRLAELMAVQNTYLSTFQSLGALGLLLGAAGLAVVQMRSVAERRGELALLQAAGFRRSRLMRMILCENLVLLVGGLGIGTAAAVVAVVPQALVEQIATP